jgi:hypothetical protein
MGDFEKGKIRNGYVILCVDCWNQVEQAINLLKSTTKPATDYDLPQCFKDLFGFNSKG